MAGIAALSLASMACGGGATPPAQETPTPTPTPLPTPTPTHPPASGNPSGFTYKGMDLTSWNANEYASTAGTTSRAAVATASVNWSGLLVTWFMEKKDSNTIAPGSDSPTDAALLAAVADLRARGIKVMLKPHVDVRDSTWRAQIVPQSPAQWFQSYRTFMLHWAEFSRDNDVEMLCIGTELASMSNATYAANWASLIAEIRAVYPGLLTYAANAVSPGDEFTSVSFWSLIDVAGLDAYVPLTNKSNPTRQELIDGWTRGKSGANMLAAFRNWAASHSKPVIMTEVGYRSGSGANMAPYDYSLTLPYDPEEQNDCYEALFEVFSRETTWFKGAFFWDWGVNPPGANDTGYSPRDKLAMGALRYWYAP